jgi:hypothetical protein
MKIKLSTLIDEFDMQPDLSESYLDKKTGEILFISEQDRFALEHEDSEPPQWQKEHLENIKPLLEDFDSERYIGLPSSFDFHEYSVMEKFIASLSSINMHRKGARQKIWRPGGLFSRKPSPWTPYKSF